MASPVCHKHAIKPVWGSHPPSWNPSLSTRFESLPTIIGNAEQPSGGGPVMGTGPQGDQLPRTQRSVNSSAQTNSQSSGVAGQACVCSSVCVERMKKKKGGGGVVGFEAREVKRPPRLLRQRSWSNSQSGGIFLLFLFIHNSQCFRSSTQPVNWSTLWCTWGLRCTGMWKAVTLTD